MLEIEGGDDGKLDLREDEELFRIDLNSVANGLVEDDDNNVDKSAEDNNEDVDGFATHDDDDNGDTKMLVGCSYKWRWE